MGLLYLLFLSSLLEGVVAFTILYGVFHFAHQPALSFLVAACSRGDKGAIHGAVFFVGLDARYFSIDITGYSAENLRLEFTVILLLIHRLITMFVAVFLLRTRNRGIDGVELKIDRVDKS